jgi:hypothetical protein
MNVALTLEEVVLVINVLRWGYVRDLHPNFRAAATPEILLHLDKQRADADRLLERLCSEAGIR